MFKQKTGLLLITGLLGFSLVLAACGSDLQTAVSAQEPANSSQITVVGSGEAFGEPDEAQVQIGVETFAESVSAATSENEAAIQQILAALEAQGIAKEDIQTTNYNIWAEQRYGDNGPEGVAGYRVNNQVNVTIRDINQVGEVIGAATEAGANAIYGIYFTVSDPTALQEEARAAAVADAKARAESLAGLNGLEVGEAIIISEVINQTPFPMPAMGGGVMMEAAAGAPSISPGQLSVQMQVQVTFSAR